MAWEENSRICLNMQLIAILSRIGVALLTNHTLNIVGKNKYKEEFVTCGGVALSNVNPSTLESKKHPHLYFAGEILDVDAITGGFNLQAAWTMGYVVAEKFKP